MESVTHIARERQTKTQLRTISEHLQYQIEISCDKVTASARMLRHNNELLREKGREKQVI